jgi:hypothetical protein
MPYLLLIIETRESRLNRPPEQGRELYEQMLRFASDLDARGLHRASQSLHSDVTGARVTVRDGKPSVTDGPFTESKEMVGGFFLIDCASCEQAIEIAASCPAAQWAKVEVREVGPCFVG